MSNPTVTCDCDEYYGYAVYAVQEPSNIPEFGSNFDFTDILPQAKIINEDWDIQLQRIVPYVS